jgi:DNA-binding MarR family transcriptional regulator
VGVKGYAIHLSFPPGNAVLMRDKAQKRHNTEGGDTIADYIRADTTLPAYLPYPRFLLKMEISQTAKLLYALLLDRSTLSQKNGWQDGEGRIFIVYPVAEIAEMLDKGCTAIKGALKELDAAGLLERERRGFSAPNRLYVKVPPVPVVRFSDQLMAGKATLIQSEKRPYDGRKTDPMMVGKPTPNKTNINNLIENQTMRASGEPPTAYGRYENIFLSKDEYDELQAEYPDRLERLIEEMSHYLAASGKAYQNYAAALHRWAANDKKGAVKQGIPDYTCMEGESL